MSLVPFGLRAGASRRVVAPAPVLPACAAPLTLASGPDCGRPTAQGDLRLGLRVSPQWARRRGVTVVVPVVVVVAALLLLLVVVVVVPVERDQTRACVRACVQRETAYQPSDIGSPSESPDPGSRKGLAWAGLWQVRHIQIYESCVERASARALRTERSSAKMAMESGRISRMSRGRPAAKGGGAPLTQERLTLTVRHASARCTLLPQLPCS